MKGDFFNQDYFERGLETGKSCYQNYRWIPELTIPLAMSIIDYLGIKRKQTILDFGCGKGFLVKAFRLLFRDTRGIDISEYALSNVPEDAKAFCCFPEKLGNIFFDFCVAKDVFEHIPLQELSKSLKLLRVQKLFAVIPLGEKGKYYAEINNLDKSHLICEDEEWWEDYFTSVGWKLTKFSFRVEGIKDTYASIPKAHGFFVLEREC